MIEGFLQDLKHSLYVLPGALPSRWQPWPR